MGVAPTFLDVDGEKSFETNPDYSARFVAELDAALTTPLAKAYTPECHNAIPYDVWLKAGFGSIQPMAYWNDPGIGLNPSYCLKWLRDSGVPAENAQVMLDGYTGGAPHSWTEYADDIHGAKGVGFSIWRTLPADGWDSWRSLIETRGIAVYAKSGAPNSTGSSASSTSGGGCSNLCAPGSKQCLDGDLYQDCVDGDGDGCTEWSQAYSCSTSWPGTTCNNGWCVGP